MLETWMFATLDICIVISDSSDTVSSNTTHHIKCPQFSEPAVNLRNLWQILFGFAHGGYKKKRSTIHFEVTSIQPKLGLNRSFQIDCFQAPNRWRLDSPVCSHILLFWRRVLASQHMPSPFSFWVNLLFLFTGATSQLTAPRANRLMLTATPPLPTWPTLSLETW